MNTIRLTSRTVRTAALLLVLTSLSTTALPAVSQSTRAEARVPAAVQREFTEDIAQRDRILRELHRLETDALGQAVNGQLDPQIALQQQNLHSRLRFVELKLDLVANRHELTVPPRLDPANEPVQTQHELREMQRLQQLEELAPDSLPAMRHRVRVALADMFRTLRFDEYPD